MHKTKREIWQETVEHYKSVEDFGMSRSGVCEYLTESGAMCAVGRCLIDPGIYRRVGAVDDLDDVVVDGLDSILMPEYRGHSLKFWILLQLVHDRTAIDGHDRTIKEILESGADFTPFRYKDPEMRIAEMLKYLDEVEPV